MLHVKNNFNKNYDTINTSFKFCKKLNTSYVKLLFMAFDAFSLFIKEIKVFKSLILPKILCNAEKLKLSISVKIYIQNMKNCTIK